jgi:hypothetical protein
MTNIKEEFVLSEKIEDLFEVEYLDSMADVQGDVSKILKEFIRLLKEEMQKWRRLGWINDKQLLDFQDLLFELAGEKLVHLEELKSQVEKT